jgi:hypothetical protein
MKEEIEMKERNFFSAVLKTQWHIIGTNKYLLRMVIG